ncbi:ATP synthase subunit delta, mitochondrial-like [Trichosurus vulpecula]|uniref:ATP synthase subunit delta, mitochondrial-like n=1 Tax=Trichosurus vulpecula TaxID=9337 RepID=UPI00186B21CB|nr:ATP synthase subunit delta, mitochondrial-like [Trichosurus vulpecula]
MLPTTLLCHCGPCLLCQAWVPVPAAPAALAASVATVLGQMSFTFAFLMQVYFKEANVKQVDVRIQSGAFGILTAHIHTLQVLKPGMVTVHTEDGTTTKYFVSSGSITVNADSLVQLLAEEAVALDTLHLVAARSNLEKAHSDLSGASDEEAWAKVQIWIEANEDIKNHELES